MRWRRITVAHSAATILLASALGACGSSDSSAPGLADAAATDSAAPDAPGKDSAVVSGDVGVGPGVEASVLDGAQGGPADATSPADAGANASDASSTGNADAPTGVGGGDASGALDADAAAVVTGGESGLQEGGPGAAGSDAANPLVCNALVNAGPTVQLTVRAGTAPASAGGPLVSGTYFLTAATAYGGSVVCAAITLKETAVLTTATTTTGVLDVVASVSLAPTQQTTHDDYTTSGSTLSLQPTCPLIDGGVTQLQYTATAGQVELTLPSSTFQGCGTLVEVFTRQ